ncbi:transcriptional regulator [Campylobacter pinnipediorum]|uniref:transcriptional regulator n=1 Tax=Campylobacter pinnipediorum TaxID=1965231 RepID=UPI00084DDE1C|nr:transcriptional regulator [Campylobacter pinnipediorum]AQW84273.1 hypothetical protein CPIN17262_0581 [Campylobacter pinnipediorum subsp. pinnipediorum]
MLIRVDTIVKDLQISKPLAYKLMKEMNDELKKEGYLTIAGRVPRTYYHKRFFGLQSESR